MKLISYFFFYTYVGIVILAGFWGAFMNANLDFQLLFGVDTNTLPDYTRINMLGQYRFLRAVELGYGVFSIIFARNIFNEKKFNALFLFIMASGVLARTVSIFAEGIPSRLMLFFLVYELVGVVMIYLYTRKRINQNGNG